MQVPNLRPVAELGMRQLQNYYGIFFLSSTHRSEDEREEEPLLRVLSPTRNRSKWLRNGKVCQLDGFLSRKKRTGIERAR